MLARTALLLPPAVGHARRRRGPSWSWGLPVTDPVTIVVPAFNQAKTIGPAVRSLALSARPGVEVLVIDDASDDGTAQVVDGLRLGNVRVIRTPPGGKATTLNTGVAFARNELIVMVDAGRLSPTRAACTSTHSPRAPTSRSPCNARAGGWSSRSRPGHGPRHRPACAGCGGNGTGGASTPCRR